MNAAAATDPAPNAAAYSKWFRYEEIFFSVMMGAIAIFSRGNPLISYPDVLWAFGALFGFNLAYYNVMRRFGRYRIIPLISIAVNILIISFILSCSGGYESYFWPMYLLPIFTACLHLNRRHVLLALCASAGFLSYFYITSLWQMAQGEIFQCFIEIGVLALSAAFTMQVVFKERATQSSLDKSRAEVLQSAIFNSANFSSIATDAKGVIQIFNVGAQRMLGYAAVEVLDKITPADISDPLELIARAKALSLELKTTITPGFEALVFKASRGIEDIYELTYIRKDGSRFPAVVSVTALRDAPGAITVKGKGEMHTWFLNGRRAVAAPGGGKGETLAALGANPRLCADCKSNP